MIKNLTPHNVDIVLENGRIRSIPPYSRDFPTRLQMTTEPCGEAEGVPLTKTVFGKAYNLPDPIEGTYLIVSQMIKWALPDRRDLVVPAETIRDAAGNIVGCRSLGV